MKMKIGMVGCGKLGLITGLTIESKDHYVVGYDIDSRIEEYLKMRKIPFKEENSDKLLANTEMRMVSLQELVDISDIIFIAVQTPHAPLYEGITRLPETRVDFDYSYLIKSVKDVNSCMATERNKEKIVVIISTVLPGTIDREIRPLITSSNFKLIYQPLFIAMNTVYRDYLNPEFVLIGYDKENNENEKYIQKLEEFYSTMGIDKSKMFKTDIRTAEAIKVFYNTFITMKIVLGNIYGEMSYKLGANVDDIYRALSIATDRVISAKYLKAGMGDGGACHPRDNIALSSIARKIDLSFDIFGALMKARECHIEWLANIIIERHKKTGLPIIILGKAFKPETNITVGSAPILLSNILKEKNIEHTHYDPYTDQELIECKAIYFIATKHDTFAQMNFVPGSVVIDPFRYISDQERVDVIRIGAK